MLRRILLTLLLGVNLTFASGQQKGDTIIVELAKSSKVIFTIQDRTDLEILKHYDFQALFQDMLTKLETNDTSALAPTGRVIPRQRKRKLPETTTKKKTGTFIRMKTTMMR